MPARNFLPALPGSILSETYTGNGIVLSFNEKEWTQTEMFFTLLWNILHSSPYRRETVQHLIIPCFTTSSILTSKRVPPPRCAFHARKKYSGAS